jgi:hypothetical protein
MKARREMRHHPPALEKQPITESPTMRSFVFLDITIPIIFKAIRYSRRAQWWNRQASIIMDLTRLIEFGRMYQALSELVQPSAIGPWLEKSNPSLAGDWNPSCFPSL